ncbi:hypothetical protein A2331_03450 [Candidatus Falkowbacteria bacterium RIFOXYB2_FULL_34_18]|uniref:Uncharacterized protein n=1 Tax=Candidatus Falkowbacteria bacterium RIFOXYD2_FULL_34_120 TaxID=1798007 RepID=A0A1F5TS91_9BACT|nr:MAG: hypothetical protein A2331_03450 [Candidatus Falkowbacteria bacterium RIFOXYB2_FULL_34_18]OGF30122.1 MAG: hypothetical protein A2500_05000 [Candidatus Falkowbacteria bacterium RIFOXYC12_FULL_34_55]OGF37544.1 MAG: hypothetical protein A2466_01845 [Candidatus Falkowbacteria bacterium RIFOXYC2_FULL_34_220]OGF39300.1 MAG: hypothetical protein A2515_02260 [Candidatus Falkowbacteria bacterium RIFOXYD12_FULL_34_57]OGF41805.1 MAG: hypothetical protein A2531_05245 [Candidatus Falkowbacteria bact
MLKKTIKTIHNLRIFFLAFILVSFLYNIGLGPIDIGKIIGAKFSSAIGVSAGVPANQINTLAMQLEEKEKKLAQKEQELIKKEEDLRKIIREDKTVIFLMVGIVVLFILVMLNYYFDYRRRKKSK